MHGCIGITDVLRHEQVWVPVPHMLQRWALKQEVQQILYWSSMLLLCVQCVSTHSAHTLLPCHTTPLLLPANTVLR